MQDFSTSSVSWAPELEIEIKIRHGRFFFIYQTVSTGNFILDISKTDARYIARGLEIT